MCQKLILICGQDINIDPIAIIWFSYMYVFVAKYIDIYFRNKYVGSMIRSMSLCFSSMRRSLKKKGRESAQYSGAHQQQQQYYDDDDYEDNSRFRPSSRQYDDSRFHPPSHRLEEPTGYRLSQRQTYDDTPHPLEQGYQQNGSLRHNGQVYRNPIMEEDDEVVTATYAGHQQIPSKLPPLDTTGGKKKKKKKFLKKMAESSPRAYYDD